MKQRKSVIWIFAIGYGIIMLLFFSTEKIENNTISSLKFNYTKSSRGVNVDTFFDKEVLIEYASDFLRNPHMRLVDDNTDVIYQFSLEEIENEALNDLADDSVSIIDFYDGYIGYNTIMNYFSRQEAISWQTSSFNEFSDIISDDILNKVESVVVDDVFLGTYDVYTIEEDNTYNPMSAIRGFHDIDKEYGVMYHKAMVFVDIGYDGYLDYSYHFENNYMVQTILLNRNNLYQEFYDVIFAMERRINRWDINIEDQAYMILRQED